MMLSPQFETMSRPELAILQSRRLRALVDRLHARVPFYRKKMETAGVTPSDITDIRDIEKLPFTTKDEMREVYPYGLLAVDKNDIVEIHTSSGTTGKPVVDAYTQKDIDIWSETMGRTLTMCGATREDIIQNAYGYGLFTGGLGVPLRRAANRRHGHPYFRRQYQTSACGHAGFRHRPSSPALPRTASTSPKRTKEKKSISPKLKLKAGAFGAEPWSDNMRH